MVQTLKKVLSHEVSMILYGVVVLILVVGCSTDRGAVYYEVRDKAIVDTLGVCLDQGEGVLRGSTVKDLAVGYVEVTGKYNVCKVVVEESVTLLGVK